MNDEAKYTAITFAPVQGFIERSRKLRDLYGASELLSYLSKKIIDAATLEGLEVISPGSPDIEQGTPNRILLKGNFPEQQARDTLLSAWKEVIDHCRQWLNDNLRHLGPYYWDDDWNRWANHSWEIFWAQANSPTSVMRELENNKLSRNWIGINWIGESSSLTGTDGIAFPGLGGIERDPKTISYKDEKEKIEEFYTELATITESSTTPEVEGKFIDPKEKLSIPELTKRLVTHPEIARRFGMSSLTRGFQEIQRKFDRDTNTPGQWTGWFMGDGDKVGNHLQAIAQTEGDIGLKRFSEAMRQWGHNFSRNFRNNLSQIKGRVIYAGGDDFLGVIYSPKPQNPIPAFTAYEWLMTLDERWKQHQQPISLSVGFVWVAGSVPQRDVLQHCREAEKLAKSRGRDRVTIRVLFNNGQYVQWTCPWNYLHILKNYRDRNGNTYEKWERQGRDEKYQPNWNHIYSDLAQLKARHAIDLNIDINSQGGKINDIYDIALALFNIYFQQGEFLTRNALHIVNNDSSLEIVAWINDLINVGWQLCTDI
ncbi:CRISPR-associated protein Cmr2 [Calothrix sp. FACHB-1219]|uniref:Cas10/Cmr2 second palm domain-containing protein n=1 Tax=unclassified Calothrix TaxID=2619626 RepID=UPI001683AB4F|nr:MULTISPECIES: type III-B CRISPR-associated protein Cas10/Cmr2 [unclassified Calothrix]MBD2207804.1 CRISPR-associated protein Cmr2 [Calothrix sp. FACHB-168]MBD2222347.1 CRISPR-associated protein Cmr2 [Calothrix sp. FACHB-1219]